MKSFRLIALFALPLCLMASGCGEPADTKPVVKDAHDHDHDHGHEHPTTLVGAVEELVELRNSIRDSFAANDADGAHDPLHEVGDILADASKLAASAGLTEEQLKSVTEALQTLTEAYGSVDAVMHGQEGAEYKDVSAKVDAAVATLVELTGTSADGHADHDHGHDHAEVDHSDHDHAEEKK
ncbi:MAG: hypothetical protein WBH50_14345 [Fuerstiella sp.]